MSDQLARARVLLERALDPDGLLLRDIRRFLAEPEQDDGEGTCLGGCEEVAPYGFVPMADCPIHDRPHHEAWIDGASRSIVQAYFAVGLVSHQQEISTIIRLHYDGRKG